MKIACVLISDFEVAVELRRRPELAGVPVVVGGLPHERKTVRSRSPEAAAHGITEGMPLRRAHGLCPEAVFLPADEALYRDSFARVLQTLDEFSPKVEPANSKDSGLGTKDLVLSPESLVLSPESSVLVCLDASGLERLFGSDRELGRRMAEALESRVGLRPRVGLAANKFAARAAALLAPPGSALVVRAGEERAFLAPLPVGLLSCSQEMQRRLQLLGLETLGQLAGLPAGALAEQFGPEGTGAARLARGIDERPVIAREIPAVLEAETDLEPPADSSARLLSAADVLVEGLVARLRSGYLACREVALHLTFADGSEIRLATTLHEPTDGKDDLMRAVGRLVGRHQPKPPSPPPPWGEGPGIGVCAPVPPLGVSRLSVLLSGFGGAGEEQLGLFRGRAEDLRKVRRAVERADAQFGEGAIRPLACSTALPVHDTRPGPVGQPLRVATDAEGMPRELFLEGRRERVREVCNRWRVQEEWWRREVVRDYYRVITESGRLCVVFKELRELGGTWGVHGRAAGQGAPPYSSDGGWFLEKIYA